jgi:hypothetical protein
MIQSDLTCEATQIGGGSAELKIEPLYRIEEDSPHERPMVPENLVTTDGPEC